MMCAERKPRRPMLDLNLMAQTDIGLASNIKIPYL